MKGVCNIPHNIYTIMIKTHENENKVVIRHEQYMKKGVRRANCTC